MNRKEMTTLFEATRKPSNGSFFSAPPDKRAKLLSSLDEKITYTGGEEKRWASREDLQMDDPFEMHEKIKNTAEARRRAKAPMFNGHVARYLQSPC